MVSGRTIRCPLQVTAASGSQYAVWLGGAGANTSSSIVGESVGGEGGFFTTNSILKALASGIGGKFPHGRLARVGLRLHASGGWTFSSLRLVVGVLEADRAFQALNIDPTQGEDHRRLYDSGVLTPATTPAIAASNTDSFLMYAFGPDSDPMPFSTPLTIGLLWETSAGAGTSDLTAHMVVETQDS